MKRYCPYKLVASRTEDNPCVSGLLRPQIRTDPSKIKDPGFDNRVLFPPLVVREVRLIREVQPCQRFTLDFRPVHQKLVCFSGSLSNPGILGSSLSGRSFLDSDLPSVEVFSLLLKNLSIYILP